MSGFKLSGNATDEESAAVAAVVALVLAEEAEVVSAPPTRPRQSDWALAWRPRIVHLRPATAKPTAGQEPTNSDQ